MSPGLEFYTDLADGAVMFPLGIAIPIVLVMARQRRPAFAWATVIGSVWAAMLILKLTGYTIAAMAPGSAFAALDLVTPSGHVASSAAIYGGLTGLLLSRPLSIVPRATFGALAIAAGIGATRILLGAHSLAEVVVGAAVGVAAAAAMARFSGVPLAPRARVPVLLVTVLIVIAFHGTHTAWEEPIHDTALRLSRLWSTCF